MILGHTLPVVSSILLVSSAGLSYAQPATKPAVAVLKTWIDAVDLQSGSNPKRPLKKSDLGRALYQGDVLTCRTPKSSFILLNAALHEVTIKQCTQGYVIPAPAGNYGPVLDRYGRTGGRSRGSMLGLLLWPVTGIRTIPATASHLQWRKQPAGTLTATLKETGSGRVLWSRSGIDATLGALNDSELESALRAQVTEGKTDPVLDLRVSDTQRASATIALLDRATEQRLQQQLASAASGLTDEALHMVRADLFLEVNLPREALEEYLALLERSPESAFLLMKASALAVEISDPRAADLVRRARAAESA